MSKTSLCDARSQAKLANELELHSALRHDRLVPLRGFHSDCAFCYLLLDRCGSGTTLADAVHTRGALPHHEAAAHMAALLSALSYLHSCGVAHRDVKPANCLLRGDEATVPLAPGQESSLVLCDLGLAVRCPPKRMGLCGTPNFVAPEVLSRTGHDMQVDAWSAGAVAFTLLAGAPPFRAATVEDTYNRVRSGVYTPPAHVTPHARDFLARALCMCPDARATAAELLQHPFVVGHDTSSSSGAAAATEQTHGLHGVVDATALDALVARLHVLRTVDSACAAPAAAPTDEAACWSMRSGGTPDDEEEPVTRLRRVSSMTATSPSSVEGAECTCESF